METFLFDGYIACFEVAVVFLVDAASFYSLLSHGLLHRPIGALLKGKTISETRHYNVQPALCSKGCCKDSVIHVMKILKKENILTYTWFY